MENRENNTKYSEADIVETISDDDIIILPDREAQYADETSVGTLNDWKERHPE